MSNAHPENKKRATRIRENVERAAELYATDSQSKFEIILRIAKQEVQTEVDYLKFTNNQQHEQIQRLQFDVNRLTQLGKAQKAELDKAVAANTELRQRLDEVTDGIEELLRQDTRTSALRRQIALNIEHEMKKELLIALGDDEVTLYDVRNSRLPELRRWMRQERVPMPESLSWANIQSPAGWRRFSAAMEYMKAFSKQGAHPTQMNGEDVTVEQAKELVDEPFDYTPSGTEHSWDETMRETVKGYIEALSQCYRAPGEKLLRADA
jgi:hypothetical protein